MVERMEKALEKSRRVSVPKTAEQKADMNIKKITEMHSSESPDMINNIWKDSTIEDQLKEAQDFNLEHSLPCNDESTANLSEGDAKEPTINRSTPHSAKCQRYDDDITKDLGKDWDSTAKCTVTSEKFSGKRRNFGNTMEDSDSDLMKDTKVNVVVLSNGTSKHRSSKNESFTSEEARLGRTSRLLAR